MGVCIGGGDVEHKKEVCVAWKVSVMFLGATGGSFA